MQLQGFLFFLALTLSSTPLEGASNIAALVIAAANAEIDACANNSNELYCTCESRGLRFNRTALRLQIKHGCALQCVFCRRPFSLQIRIALHKANTIINNHLFTAINRGDVETVYGLLVAGVTINARDDDGMTALHLAAMNGHRKIVQLLLAMPDIDVEVQDYHRDTAAHLAEKHGYQAILETIQAYITAQQAKQLLFDDACKEDQNIWIHSNVGNLVIISDVEAAPICLATWDGYLAQWYGYGVDKAREYGLY